MVETVRIGLIARDDCGGLAAQSQEFANNLPIDSTLVVQLGKKGRGTSFPFEWPNSLTVKGPWIDDLATCRQFVDQVDVVLSIETFYGPMILELAKQKGIPTVRYANPELYKREGETHVVLPTHWESERFPDAVVIPQGVTRQLATLRTGAAKHLLHVQAPAMMDRNGTGDFHVAMAHIQRPLKATIVGQGTLNHTQSSRHEYIYDQNFHQNRFDIFANDIDLLVLPRKYGGLSLPMLEAASFGIGIITTDLMPQREWLPLDSLVSISGSTIIKMVGGDFPVNDVDVYQLTKRIERFTNESIEDLSRASLVLADAYSWANVTPLWLDYFARILDA